jgi:hypothetical protein
LGAQLDHAGPQATVSGHDSERRRLGVFGDKTDHVVVGRVVPAAGVAKRQTFVVART